jgi:hypothetical protein
MRCGVPLANTLANIRLFVKVRRLANSPLLG